MILVSTGCLRADRDEASGLDCTYVLIAVHRRLCRFFRHRRHVLLLLRLSLLDRQRPRVLPQCLVELVTSRRVLQTVAQVDVLEEGGERAASFQSVLCAFLLTTIRHDIHSLACTLYHACSSTRVHVIIMLIKCSSNAHSILCSFTLDSIVY